MSICANEVEDTVDLSEPMNSDSESQIDETPINVRSNSWVAQLAVPNDPRYDQLETNLGIGQTKEGL
ncbi:hypothetical protein TNCV_3235951 [Trichonephila clavipes]|nr:hypothetical protein TNCV_3235951 [Trichonephila clavipes]